MRKIPTGGQLTIATTATLALATAWLTVSGYSTTTLPWVLGVATIAFAIYSLILWWQWRKEGGTVMGWRSRLHRERAAKKAEQSSPHSQANIRIIGGSITDNGGAGIRIGKGANPNLHIEGTNIARNKKDGIVHDDESGNDK
jgi:hypothetical protein